MHLGPDPATEPLERLLVRTGQALQRFSRRAAAEHGLSATALDVLGALLEHDAVSHRELAGEIRLAPATLTPVLDALEATGDVARVRDRTDRRVVGLSLTTRGRERYVAAVAGVAQAVGHLPQPPAEHVNAIRGHLLALLDATSYDGP